MTHSSQDQLKQAIEQARATDSLWSIRNKTT